MFLVMSSTKKFNVESSDQKSKMKNNNNMQCIHGHAEMPSSQKR